VEVICEQAIELVMRHVFCCAGFIYERVQPAKRFGSRSDALAIVIGNDSTVAIRQVIYDEARAGICETDGVAAPWPDAAPVTIAQNESSDIVLAFQNSGSARGWGRAMLKGKHAAETRRALP
jgi:hypothetical protein